MTEIPPAKNADRRQDSELGLFMSRVRWEFVLLLYCVLHFTAWVLVPWTMNDANSHPGDNYEQLSWAEHLAWGYDKHPPLPTMLLWLFERVFGASMPLTYALGGLQVATLLGITWWIARQVFDEKRALIAVLLVSCITYYTNRLHFYNHNTGLLVACAMSVAFAYKAAQTEKIVWYALLGVSWGLGLLSKYQMVIAIGSNLIFLWWVANRQLPKLIARLVVAGIACALVIAPHVLWLIDNHFPSFNYAAKFVAANLPWLSRPADIAGFLIDQLMRIAPIGAVVLIFRRLPSVRAAASSDINMPDASSLTAPLVIVHAWAPLAMMCSLSLLFGTDLQMHWGTAFIWMLPLWMLRTQFGKAISTLPIATIFGSVAALQLVMLLSYR